MTEAQGELNLLIPTEDLRKRILSSDNLPAMPAVATKAIAMADDPNCEISDFVSVIEQDPQFVTDILSMSNSSAFQLNQEITSIGHAVAIIGFRQCKNMLITSSMLSLSKKLPPVVESARQILWQHGIQTATIARQLNKALKLGFNGEEFSAAMIHDIGRLMFAATVPDVFEIVDRLTFCEYDDFLEFERNYIGTDHCEIGVIFAEGAKLPTQLVDVIQFHHSPESKSAQPLVGLIATADHMANHLIYSGTTADYDVSQNRGLQCLVERDVSDDSDFCADVLEPAFKAGAETVYEI